MVRNKIINENIWFSGKKVGEINGSLNFQNLPILYQMKVGVLTKTGIFFTSRPIMQESIKTIAFNKLYKDFDNPIKKMI